MIIAGAGGHAVELYNEWIKSGKKNIDIYFFDDINITIHELFGRKIYHSFVEILALQDFVPGTGQPAIRKKMFKAFVNEGHMPVNLISHTADISSLDVMLGNGLNVMHQVYIGPRVSIGNGTLINARALVHHDTSIGEFCEICPGVHISGGCRIGDEVFIGTGAVILPGVKIGNGAIIGAGAVVTKDIPDGKKAVGIPARYE